MPKNNHQFMTSLSLLLTLLTPPPLSFFAITQKIFVLGSSNFLTFLTNTCPSLKAKSWAFIPTALFCLYKNKSILDFNIL